MATDDFMASVMSSFKDKLNEESQHSLKQCLKQYQEKLVKLQQENKKLLSENITAYNEKREKLEDKFTKNVDKLVYDTETKINKKISAATNDMDARLAKVDDELFNDPNRLYQKIVNASNELKKQRADFQKERKLWDTDDKRCAEWLGISFIDAGVAVQGGLDDDEKEEPANNAEKRQTLQISDNDFITIKIDDKTFRTMRGTLTQVPHSFMAKLFGAHSDMIHRDETGAYCLNCNAEVFGQVLEVLRRRGSMTHDFKMTHSLYAALVEYGLLDAFFPAYNISELGLARKGKDKADYHIIFQSWRSSDNNENYIRWNIPHLSNANGIDEKDDEKIDDEKKDDDQSDDDQSDDDQSDDDQSDDDQSDDDQSDDDQSDDDQSDDDQSDDDQKDDEKKEDVDDAKDNGNIYWHLNPNDNSELIIKKAGWYRYVFRCCIYHKSAGVYVNSLVNGSTKEYCYHSNDSSERYKSYNLNEIREFKEGDKLRFYASTAAYKEEKSSYFCIERIPNAILDSTATWTSSATDSSYRQWNSTVKSSSSYSLGNSNKNITMQKGGLYRVSCRSHMYYGSAGSPYMYLYEYRNGGEYTMYNYQSNAISSSQYECCMYDEICSMRKSDYVQIYDGGYGKASNASYDSITIQPMTFSHLVGYWRSSSSKDTNLRKWNYEQWGNNLLYKLDADQVKIEVNERGFYRISARLTNSQPSGEGHSSLYINDQEYTKCRMGSYNGTYSFTVTIQEIVSLKEGDKLHFWSSHPSNSEEYNSFWIEKIV